MSPELLRRPVEVPPGYPREYERELRLRDGRIVWVRPVLPTDAPQLGEAIRTADPETLRRRFLGGPPHVTPALLVHLSIVDYQRRFALVAMDSATAHGIAIARYEQMEEAVAEVAVAVDAAYRSLRDTRTGAPPPVVGRARVSAQEEPPTRVEGPEGGRPPGTARPTAPPARCI
jgi:hypothetical protein